VSRRLDRLGCNRKKKDGKFQPGHCAPQDPADVLLVHDICESVSALTRSGVIRKALLAQCLPWVYACYRLLGVKAWLLIL